METDDVIDGHVHCAVGSVHLLLQAMDIAGIERALVLPWPGDTEALLEEVYSKGPDRLRVAVTPNLTLCGTPDWDKELGRVDSLAGHVAAVKLYKEASFGFREAHGHLLGLSSIALDTLWTLNASN